MRVLLLCTLVSLLAGVLMGCGASNPPGTGVPGTAAPRTAAPRTAAPRTAAPRTGALRTGASRTAAGLSFEPPEHDLGRIGAMRVRVVELPWRRTGEGPLRVLGVRTGCGCALVEDPPRLLPAGARGALRLKLHPRMRNGPFLVRLRVYTTAPPPADRVVVRVRGHVRGSFSFHPPALDLGARSPGARLQREIEVRWARPEDVLDPTLAPDPDSDAEADAAGDGAAEVESPDRSPGALRFLRAELIGLEGRARVEPPARDGLPGCLLRLELRVPEKSGPFRGRSTLMLGRRVLGSVPVRGQVESVEPSPPPR